MPHSKPWLRGFPSATRQRPSNFVWNLFKDHFAAQDSSTHWHLEPFYDPLCASHRREQAGMEKPCLIQSNSKWRSIFGREQFRYLMTVRTKLHRHQLDPYRPVVVQVEGLNPSLEQIELCRILW
jgi:hypothetical protein